MTYARARLWLGISTVGFWVTLSVVALWLRLPDWVSHLGILQLIPSAIAAYVLVSFPFDLLGGYLLPRRYNRFDDPFKYWVFSWLKGVLTQSVSLCLLSILLWQVLSLNNLLWSLLAVVGLQLYLAVFQPVMASWVGRIKPVSLANGQKVWQSRDRGFTGGVSALGQSVMPEQWASSLESTQLSWLQTRRNVLAASLMNGLGAMAAVGFNTVGFLLVNQWFHLQYQSPSDWLTLVFGFTIWSFIGVLILPSMSQRAALGLDAKLPVDNVTHDVVASTIKQLDRWQDEEPARHPWIQRIFHPLPSVEQRLNQAQSSTETSKSSFLLWHVARRALYYSWPMMNLISRAVHCNIGRPDLWVFLPAEG